MSAAPSAGTRRGILDTSTVILLGRLTDAAALPAEPLISTITLAELSVGPLVAGDERERMARQAHLQQAEADFDPLPFDAAAARAFGRVASSLRRAGGKPAARAYDAMIAATAIARGLPLYTCNPADFKTSRASTSFSWPRWLHRKRTLGDVAQRGVGGREAPR